MIKKKLTEKPVAADVILQHYEKVIAELQAKIRRRTWELNAMAKLQRADRYILSELMQQRHEYLKAKRLQK